MSNSNSVTANVVDQQMAFFSDVMGVRVAKSNSLMQNPSLAELLVGLGEDEKSETDEHVTFAVEHARFGHFMHLLYAYCPEDKKVLADFDGIFSHTEKSEGGPDLSFNTQMVTILEISAA